MVMGDLVLTHEEVNPVIKKLVEGGIEITALHNHLLRSSPAIMYMHFIGHGDPVKLATALRNGLAERKTPLAAPAAPAAPPPLDLDTTAIDQTLGVKGSMNSGVYAFNIPRAEKHHGGRNGGADHDGIGNRDQLPAHRRRQGGY
jgi:hypothetical protein